MTATENSEFRGIYVAPEAALYLTATLRRDLSSFDGTDAIRSRNLIHWIRIGLTSPDLRRTRGADLLLTFEDVVSMRVIAILRALGIP